MSKGFDVYKVKLDTTDGADVLKAVELLNAKSASAVTIMPNIIVKAQQSLTPNDTYWSGLYHLQSSWINAPSAWDITMGNSAIKVAVFDDGIDQNHPDLIVSDGYYASGNADEWYPTSEYETHGTMVAGVIAAKVNNAKGVDGLSPNIRLVSAKIGHDYVEGGGFKLDPEDLIETLNWAYDNNCRVYNFSWGSKSSSSGTQMAPVDAVMKTQRSSGEVIIFAASGNEGTIRNYVSWPASSDATVAVGAISSANTRASFSQYGPKLDLVSYGVSIGTTDRAGSAGAAPGSTLLAATASTAPHSRAPWRRRPPR